MLERAIEGNYGIKVSIHNYYRCFKIHMYNSTAWFNPYPYINISSLFPPFLVSHSTMIVYSEVFTIIVKLKPQKCIAAVPSRLMLHALSEYIF